MKVKTVSGSAVVRLWIALALVWGLFIPLTTLTAQAAPAKTTAAAPTNSLAASSANAPVLLVYNDSYSANKFGRYLGEIMNSEGFNLFDTQQLPNLTATILAGYDSVVLAQTNLTSTQASMFTQYVQNGGNLIAMRPDAQLASVFGLGTSAGTLSNGYMAIQTSNSYGQGFAPDSLQLHTTADKYSGGTAQTVALLYTNATTATTYPAITANNYGNGKAIAYTYDLAQTVVYIRQGNPANADVDADGDNILRTVDLYYNWIDLNKMPLPQADLHQRLFARILGQLNTSAKPLPQFWYYPNNKKTAIVLTSDAHSSPDSYFQNMMTSLTRYNATTSFYEKYGPVPALLNDYTSRGNTFSIHPYAVDNPLSTGYDDNVAWFQSTYGAVNSRTVRTHRIQGQGWVDGGKIAKAHGFDMDYSYYRYGAWLKKADNTWARGYIGGSGRPAKLIDQNGLIVDVFGQYTEIADDQMMYPGPEAMNDTDGYFYTKQAIDSSEAGNLQSIIFQMHVDYYAGVQTWAENTLAYARSLNLPILNGEEWLHFTENRYNSSFSGFNWANNQLSFSATVPGTQSGQSVVLPLQSGTNNLGSVTLNGSAVSFTTQTLNGQSFAFVTLPGGTSAVVASYSTDTTPPVISQVSAAATGTQATITWTTNEAATSVVNYGTTPALGSSASTPGSTLSHSVSLTGLTNGQTYYYKAISIDPSNNSATSAQLSFVTTNAAPSISSVAPNSGPTNQTTTITLSGTNFVAGATVKLGTLALSGVSFVSATQLTAQVASGTAQGVYSLSVTNPDNQSATLPNAYTVSAAATGPSITQVKPGVVTNSTANTITITGSNFAGAVGVELSGTAVSGATLVNSSTITFSLPAGYTPGTYSLKVINGDGLNATLANALVVLPPAIIHTTQANFATGGVFTNTAAATRQDGEVKLKAGLEDYFNGTTLDTNLWTSDTWSAGGSSGVSGGSVAVSGAYIRSQNVQPLNQLQARLKFAGNTLYQHFGYSEDLSTSWILFSVPGFDSSKIYARSNINGIGTDTPLNITFDTFHDFVISVSAGAIQFYVDGTLVATHNVSATGSKYIWLSGGSTAGTLVLDSVVAGTYPASGTYLSPAMDAGQLSNWNGLYWAATGNTATIQARTSTDGTNWSGWSTATATTGNVTLSLAAGRYLQYGLNLSTSDNTQSPEVQTVAGIYGSYTPGAVASIVVSPSQATLQGGATQQFTAQAFDSNNVQVSGTTFSWSTTGGGTINSSGLYTAGNTGGNYPNSVVATSGAITGAANVTVNVTPPAPTLSSVSPNSGPTNQTTAITLSGTNFVSGATVKLGTLALSGVSFVSATQLTAQVASGTAQGVYSLTVTNPDSQSATLPNAYTVNPPPTPAPTLTSVSPTSGPANQNTTITLNGTNFVSGATVKLGTLNLSGVTFVSATQVRAVVASGTAQGVYGLSVTNPDNQSATLPNAYTVSAPIVQPAPTLTSVSPNNGPTNQSISITLTGTNFAAGATVKLGTLSLGSITLVSSTQLRAVVSANTAAQGVYSLTVTNSDGQSATLTNAYTVTPPPVAPTISQITPNVVTNSTATTVTISGTNFVGPVTITLSGTTVSGATLVNATTITFSVPAGYTPSTYNVKLVNSNGTNTTLNNGLVVLPPAIVQTTAAQFKTGAVFTNTASTSRLDGELKLKASLEDYFSGPTLDTNLWTSATWSSGGSVGVSGGNARVSGAYMRTNSVQPLSRVQAQLKFASNMANQHFGYSEDLSTSWILFSVPAWDTSKIYARSNINGVGKDTALTTTFNAYHAFVIGVTSTAIQFYVDGTLVATHTVSATGSQYVWLSGGPTTGTLAMDSVVVGTYPASGTYLSAPLDAGQTATWSKLYWAATGSTATIQARTSTDGTNWSAWSTATATTGNVALSLPPGRYLQYQVNLSTGTNTTSPEVQTVAAVYG